MPKPNQIDALVTEARELTEAGRDLRATARDLAGGLQPTLLRRIAATYIFEKVRDSERRVTLLAERGAVRAELLAEFGAEPSRRVRVRRSSAEVDTDRWRMFDGLVDIVNDYTATLRMEWTNELLASTFALPDGTLTTWGSATVEQHQIRVAMFMSNAEANLEGAARHRAALEALDASGAGSLDEMLTAA